jgi:hypothetical protein
MGIASVVRTVGRKCERRYEGEEMHSPSHERYYHRRPDVTSPSASHPFHPHPPFCHWHFHLPIEGHILERGPIHSVLLFAAVLEIEFAKKRKIMSRKG